MLCNPKWKVATSNKFLRVLGRQIQVNIEYSFPLFKEFNEKDYYVNFLEYKFHEQFDGIIGNNILLGLEAIIDYKNRLLRTRSAKIPFYLNEEEESYEHIAFSNTENVIEVFSNEFHSSIPIVSFAKHLDKRDVDKLKSILLSFKDVFFKEGDNLSLTNEIQHEIETKNNIPIYSKLYRYPEIHRSEVERQIQDMLKQNIIKHSNSPYNSPIWVVPKKIDNSQQQKWRIVVDYRKLNEQTVDDRFPMPNIDDLFDKIGKCTYFSSIDLAKGFHQIEVLPRDRPKTAFSTSNGHYEFIRMPFGLKNAPATFQRLMNNVLKDFINKICVVYLDDILIFSTSFDEHLLSIRKIMERLREVNLKVQIDKCHFAEEYTNFLGHTITNGGIKPNNDKIEAIQKMKLPSTVKEIKQFLGISGYYRKFIKDYAKVAYPIIKYLKKDTKINKSDTEYINAFNKLKLLLTSDPILKSPNFDKPFTVTCDASNYAIGAVLSQNNHPISYASRTLNRHETKYSTIEKELLAIVYAVKYFRTYIYGRKFIIRTDHKPLVWLNNLKEPNMKLQRWKIQLNEYNFTIEYIKGKENHVADGLSRYPNNDLEEESLLSNIFNNDTINNRSENDEDVKSTDATIHSGIEDETQYIYVTEKAINLYKNQIYLEIGNKERVFRKIINKKIQNYVLIDNNSNLLQIMKGLLIDKGIMCVYCENNQLYVQFQDIYVKFFANNKNLKILKSSIKLVDVTDKEQILNIVKNEHLKNNHRGIQEVFNELKQAYYHPNLLKIITQYINNCETCILAKHDRHPIKLPFRLTETANNFNAIAHIDIWFPYRNVMFLTTIDKFSKYATIHKLTDRTWISILKALKERIQFLGKMNKLVYDNERCILHNAVELFLRENEIESHVTTPGNKTGNADIERLHGTLNEHLRIMSLDSSNDDDIDTKIFKAITFYNNTIHTTTKLRPIDFINKNYDRNEIQTLAKRLAEEKEDRIKKLNKNRTSEYKLNENIVSNRNIAKNSPKYKRLNNYKRQGNYIFDTSRKRNIKYNTSQQKRKFKYQKSKN